MTNAGGLSAADEATIAATAEAQSGSDNDEDAGLIAGMFFLVLFILVLAAITGFIIYR